MTTPYFKKSICRSPSRLGVLLIPVVFACFALARSAQAVSPEPSKGDLIVNMAEEDDAVAQLGSATENAAAGQAAPRRIGHNKWAIPINIRGPFQCAGGNVILGGNVVVTFQHQGLGVVKPIHLEFQPFTGVASTGNRKLMAKDLRSTDFKVKENVNGQKVGVFNFQFDVTGPGLGAGSPLKMSVRYGSNEYIFHEGEVKRLDPDATPRVRCIREAILALRPVTLRYKKEIDPQGSPLFEIARVLVCFDHVARCIVNANDGPT